MSDESDRSHDHIWHVRRGGREHGPFPSGQLRRLLDEGVISPDDEVSEDRRTWRRAAAVPEVLPVRFRREVSDGAVGLAAERRRDARRALRALAVISVVVAAALAGAWLHEGEKAPAPVDCATPPGPGVSLSRCALDGLAAPGANLARAELNNASLAAAKLDRAVLEGADLRYANLAGAALGYARAAGANLKGANLRAADLAYADLRGADLGHADLSGANLGGAALDGARLGSAIWIDGRRCPPAAVGGCPNAP
jgi:hypothetical protein